MLPLSIASVCRGLPGPDDPSGGIFVWRRLEAMSRQAQLTTLQPIPYCRGVAPLPAWAREPYHEFGGLRIEHAPMFYVPRYFKSLDGRWLYRAIRKRLAALKQSGHLDAVDAHFGYPEGVGALMAAREVGVPLFVTLRGFEAEYLHRPLIGRQIRYLLRNADGCICVAEYLRKLAIAHGAHPQKTRVIHNAIDRRQFRTGDKEAARRKTGLPIGAPIVISVGHLTARKRHHVLIAAFAAVRTKFPDAILLIIGARSFEPDYPRQLAEQVDRLGLSGMVRLLGNMRPSEVADFLRAADVFALGSQREGCCNAVLEALACGLPAVTTPVGDNELFIKHGENGYLVPVDDVRGMSGAISSALARSDWNRDRISDRLKVGSWDDVAAEIVAFVGERSPQRARAA